MAIGMARAGATIAAIGRDRGALEKTAEEISSTGGSCAIFQADVCNETGLEQMVSDVIEMYGTIDILINNAGISRMNRTLNISKKEWNEIIDTNLNSVFSLCRIAGEKMIEKKQGVIINIASVLGQMASNRSLHYCASKAAIIHMTRALALEWAPFNIRVTCIAPGFFETEMTKVQQENQRHQAFLMQKIPFSRFGRPEEIAGSAVFLASDAASYITGTTLFVDGGYSIW
jgi:NAD(P)-dependent dehydrogenase (short-subunit alcohol dehydrogenase family)